MCSIRTKKEPLSSTRPMTSIAMDGTMKPPAMSVAIDPRTSFMMTIIESGMGDVPAIPSSQQVLEPVRQLRLRDHTDYQGGQAGQEQRYPGHLSPEPM